MANAADKPCKELIELGRGILPGGGRNGPPPSPSPSPPPSPPSPPSAQSRRIKPRRITDPPVDEPVPTGSVRVHGKIRPLTPGMKPGPTELIGTVKNLVPGEGLSDKRLAERGDRYNHPMFGDGIPFPVEVPVEDEVLETKRKKLDIKKALEKAKDVLKKVDWRKGDRSDDEKDRPTISAPTNFRKVN